MVMFLSVTLYPAQALAFVDNVEFYQRDLIFVRDSELAGSAIVGIEAFPRKRTVAGLLASSSLTVRSSLAEGSKVRVLSVAYSSTIGQTDDSPFITASGRRVSAGTLATNFLPIGAKVRIGQQIYTVWDRMNSRYDNKYIVDIWHPSRTAAIHNGARMVELEVVSIPKYCRLS
jgi:3D (Asp-Asp-Asp) domain-containing protein